MVSAIRWLSKRILQQNVDIGYQSIPLFPNLCQTLLGIIGSIIKLRQMILFGYTITLYDKRGRMVLSQEGDQWHS